MVSKTISIHSSGNGFRDAHQETEQLAAGLPEEQRLHLCLITEEIISLFRSVIGEINSAEFWLEEEAGKYTFHLTAKQKLGNVQRSELIESSSSGENDGAPRGFLGKLREMLIQAMSVGRDIDHYYSNDAYSGQAADLSDTVITTEKWDKFERSVLLGLTDNVNISIRGGVVELTAVKQF